MWREDGQPDPLYTDVLELDLGNVEPCISGPSRPHDRISLKNAAVMFTEQRQKAGVNEVRSVSVTKDGETFGLKDGAILIAAITSCTNTSNPSVMIGAGLLARNAVARGLRAQPWVKTTLAPGSRVVSNYLDQSGLTTDLDALGFNVVGFGCTACIGNSGPLDEPIAAAVKDNDLLGCSVLSGNRNFEGRIHPLVRMNFLASPPLVVAYALAGSMDVDLTRDALGTDDDGNPVYLKDLWPSQAEIQEIIAATIDSEMFRASYEGVFAGDENWNSLDVSSSEIYDWVPDSTYVRNPPYFEGMSLSTDSVDDIHGARALALLGDNITTDHISPAGSFAPDSPAGQYLVAQGVNPKDFNSYGSRRGNHEVMMRGTFANIRLRNQLAPGTEGGWTRYQPDGKQMTIYDASVRYLAAGTPLIVIAGKEYGMGSSRDWAAKGTKLLGVRAVITETYERIHRSNLIGMGVLPLQFCDGDSAASLGLDGTELFDITGLNNGEATQVTVTATKADGSKSEFQARVRIDTPKERDYFRNGGILHYVLRQLAA
jgi:aconitate hydratase